MAWDQAFDDPIQLPNGRIALTLKDAGDYITTLPARESGHPKWQTAMEALIMVAEGNGPTMFARMGVLQAIHRDAEPKFGAGKRITPATKWGRRKLARDR